MKIFWMPERRNEMNCGKWCDVGIGYSLDSDPFTDSKASPAIVVINLSSSHCTYLNIHHRLQCVVPRWWHCVVKLWGLVGSGDSLQEVSEIWTWDFTALPHLLVHFLLSVLQMYEAARRPSHTLMHDDIATMSSPPCWHITQNKL